MQWSEASFSALVAEVLEPLRQIKLESKDKRTENDTLRVLDYYFSKQTTTRNNTFELLRLLLPTEDERDCKILEVSIARIIIRMVSISTTSEDAQMLLNWPGQTAYQDTCDFADTVRYVVAKRELHSKATEMSIGRVNGLLDRIATSRISEKQTVFNTLYHEMTAVEISWIVRIIVKDLGVGDVGHAVLTSWNSHGPELLLSYVDLKTACREFEKTFTTERASVQKPWPSKAI